MTALFRLRGYNAITSIEVGGRCWCVEADTLSIPADNHDIFENLKELQEKIRPQGEKTASAILKPVDTDLSYGLKARFRLVKAQRNGSNAVPFAIS
jgi:hypothetical protein